VVTGGVGRTGVVTGVAECTGVVIPDAVSTSVERLARLGWMG
jgi:hypothetical protein